VHVLDGRSDHPREAASGSSNKNKHPQPQQQRQQQWQQQQRKRSSSGSAAAATAAAAAVAPGTAADVLREVLVAGVVHCCVFAIQTLTNNHEAK
jgi:transcription initiation factor TFIID subunit TAF12